LLIFYFSGLDHPNIVPLLGFCMEPYCIIMDFYKEGNLFSYLHDPERCPGDLEWTTRLKLAKDIAKGIAFLHSTSPPVMHRDLKSLNILVRLSTE
jgi:serine/threonine protein kinase